MSLVYPLTHTVLIGAFIVLTGSVALGQKYEVLFSNQPGRHPDAALVQGTDGWFYGTTPEGGASLGGTVFQISSGGTHKVIHNFRRSEGSRPRGQLVQGSDGSLYGTTSEGGNSDKGTVFKITTDGTHHLLHSFNGTHGSQPEAGLIQGSDGNFYGTTWRGGAVDLGTVFKITADGAHTLLHSFNATDGRHPRSELTQGSDGSLYGTTAYGGSNEKGTVFKITPTGGHTVLHRFNGTNGGNPAGALLQASDGSFYGTTFVGGSLDLGTVFRITSSGVMAVLHSFDGNNGRNPLAGLVQGSDGSLYGTASEGAMWFGVVYKITTAGVYTAFYQFGFNAGRNPYAALVAGSDGNFYGSTRTRVGLSYGSVFRITPAGVLSQLHSFESPSEGSLPGDLVQGSDGSFYGTAFSGGEANLGTVFKINTEGTQPVLSNLKQYLGTEDGSHPSGGLVEGSDGSFYGTTAAGGVSGYGTAFKITSDGTYTVLHSFNGSNGRNPYGRLVQASDGNLYGTTYRGGASDYGTVFKITPMGTFMVLHSFSGTPGRHPRTGLIQGSDGHFYGTTGYEYGVVGDYGTVFRITASGTHSLLHRFDGSSSWAPEGPLVEGRDGRYYGTTAGGGPKNAGTVYSITAGGKHTVIYSFDGTNGAAPSAGLVQGSDGSFYGTTRWGGDTNSGTVFKVTSRGVHTVLHFFDGSLAMEPTSRPIFGRDGNLYGTAGLMCVWRIALAHHQLHSTGGAVPQAGQVGHGIPAGAVWHKLGVPALGGMGQMALLGEWKVGAVRGAGLFHQSSLLNPLEIIAAKGAVVPGLTNTVFSAFKDPLVSEDGAVVWHSSLANAPSTTGAVQTSNNGALFFDSDGAGANAPVILARRGQVAAGTAQAKWESFDSVAVSVGSVAFSGKLVISSSAGVSESTNTGLWIHKQATSGMHLLLREGDALLGSKVKVISALATRTKAGGHGQGVISNSNQEQIALRVTLSNGSTAVGVVSSSGGISFPYQSGMPAGSYGAGAQWASFGMPSQSGTSGALAFLGVVKPGTGTATRTNNIALFSEDETTSALTKRYGLNDGAIFGRFGGFGDPVNGPGRTLAFIGSMVISSAEQITTANNDGVWYDNGTALKIVAREGAQPPGVATGARWRSFSTVALCEGRGPIFTATLQLGRGGITASTDRGLWATDSSGFLTKLVQEGDPIGASKVASFQVLSAVPGSPTQRRSFNKNGDVLIQAFDTSGGTHLLHVKLP